eukprot:1450232-Amphidinium_carterae.1
MVCFATPDPLAVCSRNASVRFACQRACYSLLGWDIHPHTCSCMLYMFEHSIPAGLLAAKVPMGVTYVHMDVVQS